MEEQNKVDQLTEDEKVPMSAEQNRPTRPGGGDPDSNVGKKPTEQPKPEKKSKKKISKLKIIIIVIVVFIIWAVAVQIMAAERYDAVVNVISENKFGINPTDEVLDFGDLSSEEGVTRLIKINNDSDKERYVMMITYGEIFGMIDVSEKNLVIKSGETKDIEFELVVPLSAEIKQYKGKVMIFRWPKIF